MVENYRVGTLKKWGIDYDVLSAINPRLIMLKVSGFGQTGPHRSKPGFGTLAEAYTGYAHISGSPDGPPLLPGFGLGDASTGLMGAFLLMVALHERDKNGGVGQVIDLGLYETLYTLLGPQVVNYDQLGIVQQRAGSRLPFVAPRNTYRTRDGKWIAIAGSTQGVFERICAALEIPQVAADPRFVDNRTRLVHVDALDEFVQTAVAGFDFADLMQRFERSDAAVAPVYDVAQTFEDPHFQARENVVTVHDDDLGPMRMQNVVGKLSRTPGRVRRAGPQLGQHNRQILLDQLGFSAAELAAAGIIV